MPRRLPQLMVAAVLVSAIPVVFVVLEVARDSPVLIALLGGLIVGALIAWVSGKRISARLVDARNNDALAAKEVEERATRAGDEKRLLEQVLAVVRQGVIVVGEDDAIAYANPAAYELVRPADRLAVLVPHGLQRLVRQARISHSLAEEDLEHGSPPRILRAAAVSFPDDKRVLLTIADVTASSRVESMRRDFVAAASHELKTPVAAVQASTEALLLALDRDPLAAERFALQVEKSARQLARLVSDLLDLSRTESVAIEAEPVDVEEVAVAEVKRLEPQAEEAGVALKCRSQSIHVVGSPSDLTLAIRNLIENALRHTPRGGMVTLSIEQSNGTGVISVTDTGEGIPQRELPRIFERFYRVDTARARATGGTGLGLAIVKHVAEGHGGSVGVESELGVGTTFRIVLPIASGGGGGGEPEGVERPQGAVDG